MRRLQGSPEKGSSMAWAALVLSLLVVPLLTLVVDGGRLLYVQGRLQTAADAACEDAAWSAADRRVFRDQGLTTYQRSTYLYALAQNTFNQTLADQTSKHYSAVVQIHPNFAAASMACQAQAQVPLLTAGGLLWSPVTIRVESAARIRFTR